MTNEKLRQFLISRSACPAFMDWLGKRDSAQMWAECRRPDWLLWWAGQAVSRQELVLAACDCAETALRYVSEVEDRPRLAIETARRWARGEATVKEVDAARVAAISAYINAGYAASFAALTAYATPAPFAAHSAAVAAKEAARAAAHAPNAAAAANDAAYAEMCQLIRQRWPECPLPEVTA
jgi:hypothetical protein